MRHQMDVANPVANRNKTVGINRPVGCYQWAERGVQSFRDHFTETPTVPGCFTRMMLMTKTIVMLASPPDAFRALPHSLLHQNSGVRHQETPHCTKNPSETFSGKERALLSTNGAFWTFIYYHPIKREFHPSVNFKQRKKWFHEETSVKAILIWAKTLSHEKQAWEKLWPKQLAYT